MLDVERTKTHLSPIPRSAHISSSLAGLRRLRWAERIEFKPAVLTFWCLHGAASRCLALFCRTADIMSRRRLCPSSIDALDIRATGLAIIGNRAFPVAGLRLLCFDTTCTATSIDIDIYTLYIYKYLCWHHYCTVADGLSLSARDFYVLSVLSGFVWLFQQFGLVLLQWLTLVCCVRYVIYMLIDS